MAGFRGNWKCWRGLRELFSVIPTLSLSKGREPYSNKDSVARLGFENKT